jgi:hypothetical protein
VNADVYEGLRGKLFGLEPSDVGFAPTGELPQVYGVVVETGHPGAVVTLVAMLDGTTSLYLSTGGGMIGAGEHPQVAAATHRLLESAQEHLTRLGDDALRPSTSTSLPAEGQVMLHVLTYGGRLAATAAERELVRHRHQLSALFYAADDVMTQLRLLDEARNA